MSSRITEGMTARLVLSDLHSIADRLARTQQKLSSGKEITRPSDDPFAAGKALLGRDEIAANRQHQRNAEDAAAWQSATDTALGQIGDLVLRARELVVRGANDTLDQPAREALAAELDQIAESVKSAANAQYAGRYVLAGAQTQTPPYAVGGGDAYAGDGAALEREIGPGVRIQVNVTGQAVVGDDSGGLLAALRSAAANLRSGGDLDALRTTDLRAISDAHDTVLEARAVVGARANRLETGLERLAEIESAAVKLLSETEDADMARTLVDLSMQQAVYQAALKAGANLIQPSLMDFLR